MGWKSTENITREEAIYMIEKEFKNIHLLNNETLANIVEIIGDDKNSSYSSCYNYCIMTKEEINLIK